MLPVIPIPLQPVKKYIIYFEDEVWNIIKVGMAPCLYIISEAENTEK